MKYSIFTIICILCSNSSLATSRSALVPELKCVDMKIGQVTDSRPTSEIIKYSADSSSDDSKKTIIEIFQTKKYQFRNDISTKDSMGIYIDTPVKIKNRKTTNIVHIESSDRDIKTIDPNKDTEPKYKGMHYKRILYHSNYYSVWPSSVPCKDGIIKKIWKKKKQISEKEFADYNLHAVKYRKQNNLFFLPPDYLLTLDIKDNWCENKFCDSGKEMKITKIERKTAILIDDNMTLYHFDSEPFYNPDYDFDKLSGRKVKNGLPK